MVEAGVLLWVEGLMLGEQACCLKTKSLYFFFAPDEVFKTSFPISFNILLKTSHTKKKLSENGVFEMFLRLDLLP